MGSLRRTEEYGIGMTGLVPARSFCPEGRLFIKREDGNLGGSIKARTAYFILKDLCRRMGDLAGLTLIESTSGNLGIALARLGADLGVRVLCAVDPTVATEKLAMLAEAGGEIRMVHQAGGQDFRAARIAYVKKQAEETNCIWPNQYSNEVGMLAHEATTGPEIWAETNGLVDIVVVSVGTGGTICGIGSFLRSCGRDVLVVGVEPVGSIIFGGEPGPYLSSGAGLDGPSPLLQRHGSVIDLYAKVADDLAIAACREFAAKEPFGIGITGAASALVGRQLARLHPDKLVVAIAADGAENYRTIIDSLHVQPNIVRNAEFRLLPPAWEHGLGGV
jgi:cysteine synthase